MRPLPPLLLLMMPAVAPPQALPPPPPAPPRSTLCATAVTETAFPPRCQYSHVTSRRGSASRSSASEAGERCCVGDCMRGAGGPIRSLLTEASRLVTEAVRPPGAASWPASGAPTLAAQGLLRGACTPHCATAATMALSSGGWLRKGERRMETFIFKHQFSTLFFNEYPIKINAYIINA
eukprot:364550-Chlamydomonas_euryale.AAC.14